MRRFTWSSPQVSFLPTQLVLYASNTRLFTWFDKLNSTLINFGFISAKSDQSLFIKVTHQLSLFVLVYVDDILITGSSTTAITVLISQLKHAFVLKDMGEVDYFLGIQMKYNGEWILLSQNKYISDLLCKPKIQNANGLPTPMTSGEKLLAFSSDPTQNV